MNEGNEEKGEGGRKKMWIRCRCGRRRWERVERL